MQGYSDPATMSNMSQAVHVDPQQGRMKTVTEFLTSPAPLIAVNEAFAPYPHAMVAGVPYPQTPQQQMNVYNRSDGPIMQLRTLFRRSFGSAAR